MQRTAGVDPAPSEYQHFCYFHYVLDTLAGAAVAIAVVVAYRYLSGDGPGDWQSVYDAGIGLPAAH